MPEMEQMKLSKKLNTRFLIKFLIKKIYQFIQESTDDEDTTQLIRARQEKAATLARAAVSQITAKPMGRHNSTPGLSNEKASHSDGENYVPFKQRSGASTGALLGKFNSHAGG